MQLGLHYRQKVELVCGGCWTLPALSHLPPILFMIFMDRIFLGVEMLEGFCLEFRLQGKGPKVDPGYDGEILSLQIIPLLRIPQIS